MPRPEKLPVAEIEERLGGLDGWAYVDGKLRKEFRFEDFVGAFAFMTAAALHAERLNHHPEWSNVWSRVDVALTTHDAGGVTVLDFTLASKMEAIAQGLLPEGKR